MSLRVPSFKNISALACEEDSHDVMVTSFCRCSCPPLARSPSTFSDDENSLQDGNVLDGMSLDTLISDPYLRNVVASIAFARGATSVDFGSASVSESVNIDYRDERGRNALLILAEVLTKAAAEGNVDLCAWCLCVIRGALSIGVSADCRDFAGFTSASTIANWLYANTEASAPENASSFCASFPFYVAFAPYILHENGDGNGHNGDMASGCPSQAPSRSPSVPDMTVESSMSLSMLPTPSSLALPAQHTATNGNTDTCIGNHCVSSPNANPTASVLSQGLRSIPSFSISTTHSLLRADPAYAVRRIALNALKVLEKAMYARYTLEPMNRGNGAAWH